MDGDKDQLVDPGSGVSRSSRSRRAGRIRFAVGFALIVCAIVVLISRANRGGMVYYVTVGELLKQGPSVEKRGLRVAGKVVPGSVNRSNLDLSFRMTDGGAEMPVSYHGVIPDTFADDGEVVVEGKVVPGGVFEANFLMAKCPSKYQASPGGSRGQHPAGIPKTL